eukprot:GHVS01071042.1.p1 GENE.GHVS01071042.1~~GHVS01071042.1.p1  ORF type:complete len:260 (-),score=57.85 GHVS01071042.1:640-1329(-)
MPSANILGPPRNLRFLPSLSLLPSPLRKIHASPQHEQVDCTTSQATTHHSLEENNPAPPLTPSSPPPPLTFPPPQSSAPRSPALSKPPLAPWPSHLQPFAQPQFPLPPRMPPVPSGGGGIHRIDMRLPPPLRSKSCGAPRLSPLPPIAPPQLPPPPSIAPPPPPPPIQCSYPTPIQPSPLRAAPFINLARSKSTNVFSQSSFRPPPLSPPLHGHLFLLWLLLLPSLRFH